MATVSGGLLDQARKLPAMHGRLEPVRSRGTDSRHN